jgi:hypothetical protein
MSVVIKSETSNIVPMDNVSLLGAITRAASDPNVDIDKFERMMAMSERMEAKRAETSFNMAMRDAQAKMRPISANATNNHTKSKYATYDKLDNALRPIYSESGFSLSFNTGEATYPDNVRVICYAAHDDGHVRTYHVDVPTDGKGANGNAVMTKTHATGSALSYGSRYLLKMIFNVRIGEDDNDGNGPEEKLYNPADLYSAIDGASSKDELAKIGASLAEANIPEYALKLIRAKFAERLKAVK